MDYYYALLNSYSLLKKRKFKLSIQEQEGPDEGAAQAEAESYMQQAKGKTFKNYQAGFRNWVKSPYVQKTDKIRNELARKREQEKDREKEAEFKKMEENGEIGVPEDFGKIVDTLANKMGNNG